MPREYSIIDGTRSSQNSPIRRVCFLVLQLRHIGCSFATVLYMGFERNDVMWCTLGCPNPEYGLRQALHLFPSVLSMRSQVPISRSRSVSSFLSSPFADRIIRCAIRFICRTQLLRLRHLAKEGPPSQPCPVETVNNAAVRNVLQTPIGAMLRSVRRGRSSSTFSIPRSSDVMSCMNHVYLAISASGVPFAYRDGPASSLSEKCQRMAIFEQLLLPMQ